MSIEGLFDHRAEVWRPVETRGIAGEVVLSWLPIERPASGFNCAVVPLKLDVQNIGPGETTRGRVELYLSRRLDVEERDVVKLTAGPESVSSWRVLSVTRPRGHHIEAGVEPWVGELVEAEEES